MRANDDYQQQHPRAPSRFYYVGGEWFYSTREGEHGPYASREEAEADAHRYAGLNAHLEEARRARED